MNDEPAKPIVVKNGRWKWPLMIGTLLLGTLVYAFGGQICGVGPNGPWSAADHNRDRIVTREEMKLFGTMMPHRIVE